jgi:hypothetical protein
MSVELKYLALVTAFTALMWIPYILNMIMVRGGRAKGSGLELSAEEQRGQVLNYQYSYFKT